jgi:NADPH2:quinone reductase
LFGGGEALVAVIAVSVADVVGGYASIVALWLWANLSRSGRAFPYSVQKFRDTAKWRPGAVGGEPNNPEWYREDFGVLVELLRRGEIHPTVAERLPLSEAREVHELRTADSKSPVQPSAL